MLNILLAIVVSASIDSTMIMIGDQTDMHLKAVSDPSELVQMPVIGDLLMDEIEVVKRTKVDTTITEDGRRELTQTLTLTCFKDSLYSIPPLTFKSGKDSFMTEAMSLNVVQPFEMDTTMQITDIKANEDAPIWWWGIIRWILLGLLIAGIIGLAIWIYLKYFKHDKEAEAAAIPLRPAEEVALEKLDRIKKEEIWQEGRVKEYHTQLTDVIREYIGRRFGVMSTEKTSDETLKELRPILRDNKELFLSLESELRLADLVKFAKWTATPEENEQALRTAYHFVHETTPQEQPNEPTPNNQ